MKILLISLALILPLAAQRQRVDNAPKVGESIPQVALTQLSDKKVIDLSKPEKITVLIFGSHT